MNAEEQTCIKNDLTGRVFHSPGVPKECPVANKPSADDIHWYVLRVTYSRELALKNYLDLQGIESFIPMELWALDMYGLNKPQGHDYDNFYKVNLLADELEYIELIKSDIIIYASGAGIQHNLHEGSSLIYSLNVTIPVTICNKLKANDYKGIFVSFGSVFEIGQTIEHRLFTEEDIETSSCFC